LALPRDGLLITSMKDARGGIATIAEYATN
jgi:hypothetical protein